MRPPAFLPCASIAVLLSCASDSADPTRSFDLTCNLPESDFFFAGAARDGIPAIAFPDFVPGRNADFLDADERVLGVVLHGKARAYPLSIIWWHEIVNDFIDQEPVAITYCPLTGSGIAFNPTVEGKFRVLGVSGLLYENNLTMFDRETETLWNQMLLGGVCGPDRGTSLERIPVVEATWGYWKTLHPNTTIITTDTGWNMPYGIYPYGNYAQINNPTTLFPSSAYNPVRPPKELVLGVHHGTDAAAYPFGVLEDMGETVALNESVGDRPLLITFKAFDFTAMAFNRVVDGQELTFTVVDSIAVQYRDAETGSTWSRSGEALDGPLEGAQLTLYEDAYAVYWFAWSIFYPATELFEGSRE